MQQPHTNGFFTLTHQSLVSAVDRLRRIEAGYRIHARYLVSDLVMLGYIQEALEHAIAVGVLSASPVPHRAIPNARSVFEAAQYALLLATHADYAYAGALAWVFHLRKDHKLQDDLEALGHSSGLDEPRGLELAMGEMASTWDDFEPGSGQILRQAQNELELRKRTADNWLGQNAALALERQLAAYSAASGKNLPLPKAGTFKASYAALCRLTHPHTSVRPREIRGKPRGPLSIVAEARQLDDVSEMALAYAASAVNYVCLAVAIRSHLDPAA